MDQLTAQEKVRYDRQIKLPGFGLEKQMLLKSSRVLIVGAGGLGCPIAIYLAAAGVGTIGLADHDTVELSNLHRQIAYRVKDLQHFKADVLADTICGINPDLICQSHRIRLSSENIAEIIRGYDLVIDGTDNFQTRFLIGDACYFLKIPLLHGAVHQYAAQIILFQSGGPCFRCLYSQPPEVNTLEACSEAGILGVVTGAVGTIMALEAIKHLANLACSSLGELLHYDASQQSLKKIKLNADPHCPACGGSPQISTIAESQPACATASESSLASDRRDPSAIPAAMPVEAILIDVIPTEAISPALARELLTKGAALLDVRETFEFDAGHIDKAISLPLSQIQFVAKERLGGLATEKPLVVYCKSGKRSLAALPFLQLLGYKHCYSVEGGIEAWH